MIIGRFTQEKDKLVGSIDTLTIQQTLIFTPNAKGADYTVATESGGEVGAAWKRTSREGGKPFISVRFDSPFFLKPVNVALFPKDGGHLLVWDREERKAD